MHTLRKDISQLRHLFAYSNMLVSLQLIALEHLLPSDVKLQDFLRNWTRPAMRRYFLSIWSVAASFMLKRHEEKRRRRPGQNAICYALVYSKTRFLRRAFKRQNWVRYMAGPGSIVRP